MMKHYLLIITLLVPLVKCDWDYIHQKEWPKTYPSCGKDHQSPINLEDICLPGASTRVNSSLKIELVNYQSTGKLEYTFSNNGHSAELKLKGGEDYLPEAPKITGSSVDGNLYQFTALHFHWDQVS